ncbi:MAG: DUF4252 domain-containing protein [Terriglobales bacterium]
MRSTLIAFLAALLLSPLVAQQARLNLELPALAARAHEVSDVTLDGAALRLGIAFLDKSDQLGSKHPDAVAFRNLLSKLKGIYVKSFEFAAPGAVSEADLAPIRDQLRGAGWSRIVGVQSRGGGGRDAGKDALDEVYLCTDASSAIQGIAILSREGNELNVVNIVGPIEPGDLEALGGHIGIPKLAMPKAKTMGGRN